MSLVTPKQRKEMLVDTAVQSVAEKLSLENQDIVANHITKIIELTMEMVEKHKDLSGLAKKEIVVVSTNRLIKTYVHDETTKELLLTICNSMLEDMIDLVVDATKGKVQLNKFVKHIPTIQKVLKFFCLSENTTVR